MQISEMFRQLSLSEFSNIALGDKGAGTIRVSDQNRVILALDDGLIQLYQRFLVKEKILFLQAQEGKSFYRIHPDYAFTNTGVTDGPHYIIDNANAPFTGDFHRFLDIADEIGNRYTLNSEMSEYSLFTPEYDLLQIPRPIVGALYAVEYQALHPTLVPDDTTQTIELPPNLVRPLRYYAASMVYGSMNTQENTAKGIEYFNKYEELCVRLEQTDLLNTSRNQALHKFDTRGFS
jgi:hypothetical protein